MKFLTIIFVTFSLNIFSAEENKLDPMSSLSLEGMATFRYPAPQRLSTTRNRAISIRVPCANSNPKPLCCAASH